MSTNEQQTERAPGRLFLVLWLFTLVVEIASLQVRLAIFGGTGWLTDTKYTEWPERLGFIGIMALLCAAIAGLWILMFKGIQRLTHASSDRISRICATIWVIVIVVDLLFRHKITELLGNAFSFFEFATGVGGVWRMIVQACQWYGDVILLSLLGIGVFAAATWFFFRWFFKKRDKISRFDKIPGFVLYPFILLAFAGSILFMSLFASHFTATQKLLKNETMFGAIVNALVNMTTDFDADGYGMFDIPPDLAPGNGDIHPHALDTPNDGIDQDQLLGDLKSGAIAEDYRQYIESQGKRLSLSPTDRRHVILVLMESVRYDMLDAQVENQPVMPQLKSFIDAGALRIDNMFATRGFTQNSVTQTFWGSYFDPGHSLVDDFKSLGYHTAAYSGEDLLDEGFDESLGWNRAGDTVVDPRSIEANIYHHRSVPANVLMDEVEAFLDKYDTSQPLFMYLFYQDPHFPYQQDNPNVLNDRPIKRSEITVRTRPRLYRTYANQVFHLDMAAGRLIDALKKKNMLDNSLVIFVSDHGESLFDDGYLLGHGIAIQDLMTHGVMLVWGARHDVPNLISHPDIRPFIYKDLVANPKHHARVTHQNRPVLQYIGATTVPSAISYRYENGDRITFEFEANKAWRESSMTCYPKAVEKRAIGPHGHQSVDETISASSELKPTGIYRSPIPNPLQTPEIQSLIHSWEYMQWYHQTDHSEN